jgi:hypothetical protein
VVVALLLAHGPMLPLDLAMLFAIDFTLYVEASVAVLLVSQGAPWRLWAVRWRRRVAVMRWRAARRLARRRRTALPRQAAGRGA